MSIAGPTKKKSASKRGDPAAAFSRPGSKSISVEALLQIAGPTCACGGGCPRCQSVPVQAKLSVNQPGDSFEQEADRIADQVTSSAGPIGSIMAARANGALVPAPVSNYITASRGAGRELSAANRTFFETRFGRSLGGVRVHEDASANAAARSIGARAFTAGRDVYFAQGEYRPHLASGQKLLAHELAHTLQQSSCPGQGVGGSVAPAAIQRAPFVIEHSSGSTHEVPGLTDAETEFGASGSSSSLLTPAKPRSGRPITGGFKTDLDVDIGYATGVETVANKDVKALIKSAGKRIDAKLFPIIEHAATDKFVFNALDSFLNKDSGKLEVWNNDSGFYDGKSPPTIFIGIARTGVDLYSTFVHELLHYVFDKSDSILAETESTGGADHPAIEAIEARFAIVDLVRSGQSPLDKKLEDDFGRFLKGTDYFVKMRDAITKDDRAGLKALVAKSDFVKQTVSSGLLGEASSLKFKFSGPHYNYTADNFRDLGFIWAQNAAIVRHAMKTAAAVADKTNTPLKDVFATAEWQKQMNTFLDAFVKGLRKDRTKGVVSLEAKL